MRDPIESLFRKYRMSELDEDLGLADPDDLINIEFPEPRPNKRRVKHPAAHPLCGSAGSLAGGHFRTQP